MPKDGAAAKQHIIDAAYALLHDQGSRVPPWMRSVDGVDRIAVR